METAGSSKLRPRRSTTSRTAKNTFNYAAFCQVAHEIKSFEKEGIPARLPLSCSRSSRYRCRARHSLMNYGDRTGRAVYFHNGAIGPEVHNI